MYYESESGGNITLDHVIIGISNEPDGDPYYEVFNWGDNVPDTNTNVDISIMPPDPSALPPPGPACTEAECDNREISTDKLYDPSGSPGEPQTGILIDVDNAPSNPPPGEYEYVVIISPNSGDSSNQIDGIELVDEPPPP